MDLHAVEAGFDGAVHRITKLGDHHFHFFRRQRLRVLAPSRGAAMALGATGVFRRSAPAQPCGHRGKSAEWL